MKSRVAPNHWLYQIVVQDYKHRQPPPARIVCVDKRVKNIEDTIPQRTLFRWAKNGKRAMDWARKFGSVISCQKVDSHLHRLEAINYLRIEEKPIEIEVFTPEMFTVGKDLTVEISQGTKKIDVEGIDKSD